ncbi:MAG: hypothetical protein V5A79_06010, partial [Candidatus Bipolaricaulota bacterium]
MTLKNKGKFSLSFIVFLVAALLFTIGIGVTAAEYKLSRSQFKALTGDYLSNGTVDGKEIKAGDTLLLDFPSVVQEEPLLLDLDHVTVKPVDEYKEVVIEHKWKDDLTPPAPPSGASAASASDDNIYDYVDASIVIFGSGITIGSMDAGLEFKPSSPPGGDGPANAIEVDCCFVGAETLRFHNLLMPTSDAAGGFINGIKFDGSVAGILSCGGNEGIDYIGDDRKPIEFRDVRIEGSHAAGIQGNGVVFTENVGDVAGINFEELYVGSVGTYPAGFDPEEDDSYPSDSGNGILFNNNGYVKDVTISKSERISPSVSELPYAIEENDNHGLLVDGSTVTELAGLELNYARLQDNNGAGIFVRADYNTDDAISVGMTVKNTLISRNDMGIAVTSDLVSQDYSPVKIDGVQLGENLSIYDNTNGGALFDVQVVEGTKSSPGLTVVDSQFNDTNTADTGDNDQAFGLRVDAYEGIFGVEIRGSSFHGHGLDTGELNDYTGTGIELATPIGEVEGSGDEYYDSVDGVKIENSSSQYNEGKGLLVSANVVRDLDIISTGSSRARFSGNDESGIEIYGPDKVTDLAILGEDGGAEVFADDNGAYGLKIESETEIWGVTVENAEFGDERNNDGNDSGGVRLETTVSEGNIGGSEDEEAISFSNVVANGNDGN